MSLPGCPSDADLLAWLQEPLEAERTESLSAHINGCPACQESLDQLSVADERHPESTAADELLADLRRSPPPDELEAEPQCAQASTSAATAAIARASSASVSQPTALTVPESLTQLGRYEILGVLGQGGMGVVYKARNRKLDRLEAIKVLPALKLNDAGAVARFAREMKAIARLAHPHIVAARDADEADGKHFLVMEYIDGVDLKTLVKEQGPLPVEKAVDYLAQAARGLHYAHEQGIIHRDVKPANLMLDRNGTVKVLDLGLARFVSTSEVEADLTETGIMIGTVDFLAPEQAENTSDVDRRADIYSLGCSLYYLLTGKLLYEGSTVLQKVLAHRDKPIPPLRAACPRAPEGLARVFAKMVAKRPDERYQTMAEVIADLERPLGAIADSTTTMGLDGSRSSRSPGLPPIRSWFTRSRRVKWAGAGLVLLGLIGVMIPWFIPGRQKTPDDNAVIVPLTRGERAGQEWDGNSLRMKFCWCPPGRFAMGSPNEEPGRTKFESPQVEVTLSQGFWLGKFEVTQDEWERVMGTRPSRFSGAKTLPVENVTWEEAVKFCATLTDQERRHGALLEEWECRLPTEAQWEYGCRARTTTAFCFGDNAADLGDYAWHGHNSEIRTHEVGQKKPNAWGLHDMHGNAWEWCRDWHRNVLPGGVDPEVTEPATGRVIRGGGWNATANLCRSGFRSGQEPQGGGHLLGFRVAVVQVAVPHAAK